MFSNDNQLGELGNSSSGKYSFSGIAKIICEKEKVRDEKNTGLMKRVLDLVSVFSSEPKGNDLRTKRYSEYDESLGNIEKQSHNVREYSDENSVLHEPTNQVGNYNRHEKNIDRQQLRPFRPNNFGDEIISGVPNPLILGALLVGMVILSGVAARFLVNAAATTGEPGTNGLNGSNGVPGTDGVAGAAG